MSDRSTNERSVNTDQAVGSMPVRPVSLRSMDCSETTCCQAAGKLPPMLKEARLISVGSPPEQVTPVHPEQGSEPVQSDNAAGQVSTVFCSSNK